MAVRYGLVALLITATLAGCIGAEDAPEPAASPEGPPTDPFDGAVWDTEGRYSRVIEPGVLQALDVERVAFASFDGTRIAAGVWRPDVAEGERVPVILMISPYFGMGLYTEDPRTEEFFISEFVSHGYAFAKVALRGTSFSEGCMETMGPNEQQDVAAIVDHFGTAEWSNGNLTVIGLSYVGTTPWVAAMSGSPHVKTIVPMSGVTSWFELGFRNGTAETRTPIHMPLYWSQYGVVNQVAETLFAGQGEDALVQNICAAPAHGAAASAYAIATGEDTSPTDDAYWSVRDYKARVLENYDGTVFLVHGLQDWNVDADMAFPFVNQLQAQGTTVRMLLGQWQHAWPDQVSREEHVRFDFAEQLLRWWDIHLKGQARDMGPLVDVEDNLGLWRTEDTWPPADATWTAFHLGDATLEAEPTEAGAHWAANPGGAFDPRTCVAESVARMAPTEWRFATEPLEEDLRYAGSARVHVTVTPTDARGGHLYAELLDVGERVAQRVAHGSINLRFHAGGHEPQEIVPGQPVLAKLELRPADVVIPAGNTLMLRVVPDSSLDLCSKHREGFEDYFHRPPVPQPTGPLELAWGEGASVLSLPVIVRDVGDGKYPAQPWP